MTLAGEHSTDVSSRTRRQPEAWARRPCLLLTRLRFHSPALAVLLCRPTAFPEKQLTNIWRWKLSLGNLMWLHLKCSPPPIPSFSSARASLERRPHFSNLPCSRAWPWTALWSTRRKQEYHIELPEMVLKSEGLDPFSSKWRGRPG